MHQRTKKVFSLLLSAAVLLTFAFTGCSSKQNAPSSPSTAKPQESSKPQEAAKTITFKLAHIYAPDHPFSKGMIKLAEKVKEKSGGRLIINTYDSGTLGNEKDIADGLNMGTSDMAIIGPGELGKRFSPVLIFDAPYVFKSPEHMTKVTNGPVGQEMFDQMAKQTGIRSLTVLYYGTRYVTTAKVPVKTPADMKGLKLRTPDMPVSLAIAKAMGASPTPMALGEVYLALQQGVVDGQENPIPTIASQKFNEVQKFVSLTGHVIQCTPLTISEKKFTSLPDDLKKALMDSINEMAPVINKDVQDVENKYLEDWKKGGITVVQPDVDAFRKATSTVIKEFESKWGAGLYEKIQDVK